MRKYVVEFWYHTDLRATFTTEAPNEIVALSNVMTDNSIDGWVSGKGFTILIAIED